MTIRNATLSDLDYLEILEKNCFPESRRSSRRAIRNSLVSSTQHVFIAEQDGRACGSMILMTFKKYVRIYSLAVDESSRGSGIGSELIYRAIDYASQNGIPGLSLEADIKNENLIRWYERLGFEATKVIVNYYGQQEDALKMVLQLEQVGQTKNIVVTDFDTGFFNDIANITLIRANTYIGDDTYRNLRHARVFNLCSSFGYQTVGYYVSLLALARNHSVYPNVISLRDLKNSLIIKSIGAEMYDQIQHELANESRKLLILDSCFGYCENEAYQNLVRLLNTLYEAPLIRYQLEKKSGWSLQRVSILKLADVSRNDLIKKYAQKYFSRNQFVNSALRNYKYDMAILVDHEEAFPPSCLVALNKFKLAAKAQGFYVEFITQKDYRRIPEFDALFIRATTTVNNYTYDFSRYAYAEGLVVIDDPWSILRCSNKLYLYEALKTAGIRTPKTWTLNKKNNYMDIIDKLTFPIVLKKPDSAFSLGVYKAGNRTECLAQLNELFQTSEIIIAQAFIPTEFDWRIGVLDRKPLYACKYYMAKDHWQIYNWRANESGSNEGESETIPVESVPKRVINAAVRAANIIGDGLYGIDIKVIAGKVIVIETNDNPSIDYGVEDANLGDQLYALIMKSFYTRLENERRTIRKISL